MSTDQELLSRYADGSAEAFAELVRRNLDLVYAVAARHVGDAHRAQDIAQLVFIDLARKAGALRRHPALVSWLYTSARYAALKTLRTEQRRRGREQEAHAMQQILSTEPEPDWERLRPLIDDVLHELGERDREIVLLRFFRGLPFASVAGALRMNEGAARMRIERALDKMNALLARRGIRSTASALGVALAAQPGLAAPAGLAASVISAALSGAVAAGGAAGVLGGLLLMSKLKLGIAAAVVLAGVGTAVVEVRANRALRAELRTVRHVDLPPLQRENTRLHAALASTVDATPDLAELTRLRIRLATLKARPEGVVDAELRAPRFRGRATPEAAAETFCWAVDQGDLDLVASFVSFSDDTPENREAFLAHFSPAVRNRYGTAERLCTAALFGAVHKGALTPPGVAVQIVSVTPRGPDEVRIALWFRTALGQEAAGGDTYVRRADGWVMKPLALNNAEVIRAVRERLDPMTGNFVPPKIPAPQP